MSITCVCCEPGQELQQRCPPSKRLLTLRGQGFQGIRAGLIGLAWI